MPIKRQLEALVERVPGAKGVVLADWEGETVDCATRMDEYELKVLGAHIGIILTRLRQAMERLKDEQGVNELTIVTELGRSVVTPLSEDYFLVLVTERNAPLGRSLSELRRSQGALCREIF